MEAGDPATSLWCLNEGAAVVEGRKEGSGVELEPQQLDPLLTHQGGDSHLEGASEGDAHIPGFSNLVGVDAV